MIWMLFAPVALIAMAPTAPYQQTRPAVAEETPQAAIETAMAASADGWNSGDIDRFLEIYSSDPATSFVGSDGLSQNKWVIRSRYLASYPGQFGENRDRAAMSKLSFTFEYFRMLGTDHALLIAHWSLVRPDGKNGAGMTSLVFRHEDDGAWRIVADHSS